MKEVARVLSTPTSTITWRLHYARKILAAKLGAAAKKPGGKALLLALALCGFTALGAAVWSLAEGALSERAASASAAETAAETRTGATGGTGETGARPAGPARLASPAGPFVPSVPDLSTPSTQEKQNMNATALRTFAASAAIAAATISPPPALASSAESRNGAIASASNTFTLDTRPSPQTTSVAIEKFSTQPSAFFIFVR